MMKTKVMVCDDNREFANYLKEYIELQDDFEVVGIAYDGIEACELMPKCEPDYVILDIIMPRLDGLGVLEKMSEIYESKLPLVIVLSAVGQDRVTQRALNLGAEYYVIKPFDMEVLINRIRQLRDNSRILKSIPTSTSYNYNHYQTPIASVDIRNNVEGAVTHIMLELGFPAHIKGYQFVRDAIKYAVNDLSFINHVTKTLYPTIAHEHATTASRVERAIRHSIEVAWSRGDTDVFNRIFGYSIADGRGKPTNSEFIAMVADNLRLKLKSS